MWHIPRACSSPTRSCGTSHGPVLLLPDHVAHPTGLFFSYQIMWHIPWACFSPTRSCGECCISPLLYQKRDKDKLNDEHCNNIDNTITTSSNKEVYSLRDSDKH
ncbi:hypothetical protein DPMN_019556 [Dreissena polymorpha]|uniref:Uncharacterized protein n=1 Tax=Dreissena polymorpha TaxID=45954 RepID=A0A9D4NJF4_DREPO|nr:hypothetical protein DPMN_019508 [Dreissena polymorpha]KAH3895392.1 hypothetical protein DPMN_019556 [Dreissena polymorpha]